jgi:hypothetical protein
MEHLLIRISEFKNRVMTMNISLKELYILVYNEFKNSEEEFLDGVVKYVLCGERYIIG